MTTTHPKQRRWLYPPEHPRQRERYYFDDTLDAYPPYHIFEGHSTPEEIAAARADAIKRGLLPPDHPAHPDRQNGSADGVGAIGPKDPARKANEKT